MVQVYQVLQKQQILEHNWNTVCFQMFHHKFLSLDFPERLKRARKIMCYGTLFLTSWNTRKKMMIDSVLNCPSDEIKISGWETISKKLLKVIISYCFAWKVLYWHVRELHVFFEIYGCSVLCHSGRSKDEAQVWIYSFKHIKSKHDVDCISLLFSRTPTHFMISLNLSLLLSNKNHKGKTCFSNFWSAP